MNFEFKKVGGIAKTEAIRYSTHGQGARTMNFEFKKVGGEQGESIRPDASGGRDATRYAARRGASLMNFEFKKVVNDLTILKGLDSRLRGNDVTGGCLREADYVRLGGLNSTKWAVV